MSYERERHILLSMYSLEFTSQKSTGALRNGTNTDWAEVREGFLEEETHCNWWGRSEKGSLRRQRMWGKSLEREMCSPLGQDRADPCSAQA